MPLSISVVVNRAVHIDSDEGQVRASKVLRIWRPISLWGTAKAEVHSYFTFCDVATALPVRKSGLWRAAAI
jgi:hypothetical protein